MSAVIIEELDSSSESGFATPKSDRSADDFHEAFCEVLDEQGNAPEDVVDETSEGHLTSGKKFRSTTGDRDIHERREELSKEECQPTTSDSEELKNQQPNGSSAVAAEVSAEALKQAIEEADRLKVEGNKLYVDGDHLAALELYKEALDQLPESASQSRAVLYANSAAVRIKLEEFAEAAKDCSASLALEPPVPLQIKALTRRSLAYEKLDDLERALADYEKLVTLDSSNLSTKAAMRRLKPIVEERREKMKDEMIGKLKDLGNTVLGKFGMSLDNFKAEKDPTTGSYSINFKQ